MARAHLHFQVDSLEPRRLLSAGNYDPDTDPAVGFNMVGFYTEGREGRANWEQGVEDLHASGVNEVTLAFYQVLDGDKGRFKPRSGPKFADVARAARRANELGMSITVTPLFEVVDGNGEYFWRGEYNPDGVVQRRFQARYAAWVKRLTRLAKRYDADRINVGSELEQLVRNETNHPFFEKLINWMDRRFDGDIGYAANWSNYNHQAVDGLFWSNDMIDALGISAYFTERLATIAEADSSSLDPDAFEDLMATRWSEIIEQELIPYAQSRKGGEGIKLTIQEFGVAPYNRSAVVPWSTHPGSATGGGGEALDQQEQEAVIVGLLRALDGHRDSIDAVHFWTWSFASNEYDRFGLNPDHANESQATAQAIVAFINSA